MRLDNEMLLRDAVEAVKAAELNSAEMSDLAGNVAGRLGLAMKSDVKAGAVELVGSIEGCGDVRQLLGDYRAGRLSAGRSMLIEGHLKECGECLREFSSKTTGSAVDWTLPVVGPGVGKAKTAGSEKRRGWFAPVAGWAWAPACVLAVCGFFAYRAYWEVPPGVRAEVVSVDGPAYRIAEDGGRSIGIGDQLGEGDQLRTGGGAHLVLRLTDGSKVEMNERSVLGVGVRGHNVTLSLFGGAVIVEAAHRTSGHMYVKTPDARVSVTGTVFSVSSGIKGSKVGVLQGAVEVMHAGVDSHVVAGDTIATYDSRDAGSGRYQIAQQIAWSHDRDKYLPLLAQFADLKNKIEAIPFPQARYTSDLMGRMPADTLFYVSIPNLGDFLSQADKIFHDQLQQSAELTQWFAQTHQGKNGGTVDLDAMVDKLHTMSQYLGDEIVVVGMKDDVSKDGAAKQSFAIVSDLKKAGLGDFLNAQLSVMGQGSGNQHGPGFVVYDEASLNAANPSSGPRDGGYALIREHEVVFSNSVATLKTMEQQLNASASGFAASDFGQQIAAAYSRGAGVILAADLHRMMPDKLALPGDGNAVVAQSGMSGVKYLIAEHRETNGVPENHLNLQFSGTRERVASWLAAPAPMGSLEFVTPNAAAVVAGLTKDPKAIADDILKMAGAAGDAQKEEQFEAAEAMVGVNFRDDIAANLGGDFLVSLDGPVLPVPAWKTVVEVNNSDKLEAVLERLASFSQAVKTTDHGKQTSPGFAIEASEVSGQKFYAVRQTASGAVVAQYTFTDGYMIVAADRAVLMEAVKTHDSGNSLARSAAFKSLLPKDANENYSAVAYQNLGPVLTPLLSQLSGETAAAVQKLASDQRPTAICAWGRDSRIEAESDSRLFGFDFLTLGALIKGNKVVD